MEAIRISLSVQSVRLKHGRNEIRNKTLKSRFPYYLKSMVVYSWTFRTVAVEFLIAGEPLMGMGVFCGTNLSRMRAVHDAMKDTDIAWTCNKLPMIMEQRTNGSSNSPMLAAVPSRADRFISKFHFRSRMTGMIIMSWSTSRIARQRCGIVSIFHILKKRNVRTETWSNGFPVNKRLMIVIKSVGAL